MAFEGNFISVLTQAANGAEWVAQIRNDGSATVPATGTTLYLSFEPVHAAILPDQSGRA